MESNVGKLKILLYHTLEYEFDDKRDTKVRKHAVSDFNRIAKMEEKPFRDSDSKEFLKKTYDIEFVDERDKYTLREVRHTYPLTELSEEMKEAMMLILNSKEGIYTHITAVTEHIANIIAEWKDDLLIAFDVDQDRFYETIFWYFIKKKSMEIVNFNFMNRVRPLIVVCSLPKNAKIVYENQMYRIAQSDNQYYTGEEFFTQFEFDWRKALPEIKGNIEFRYEDAEIFGEFQTYYPEESFYTKAIVNHMKFVDKKEAFSRRAVILSVNYLKNDTIQLDDKCTVKYPNIQEALYDVELSEGIKKRFFLVIDVDETLYESEEICERCWFGGWSYPEYIELYDKDMSLIHFKELIPDILKRMVLHEKN